MYRSKLFNIVLNHRFTNLDCADQYVVQMCPELTKYLPCYIHLLNGQFILENKIRVITQILERDFAL